MKSPTGFDEKPGFDSWWSRTRVDWIKNIDLRRAVSSQFSGVRLIVGPVGVPGESIGPWLSRLVDGTGLMTVGVPAIEGEATLLSLAWIPSITVWRWRTAWSQPCGLPE